MGINSTKVLRGLAILAAVILLAAPLAISTPEYSKKEQKHCVFCHTALGKADLNEAGKYYKDHDHSFKGYVENKKP